MLRHAAGPWMRVRSAQGCRAPDPGWRNARRWREGWGVLALFKKLCYTGFRS